MVLKGYLYMGASLCRLCDSNIFWCKAVFSIDAYHVFPQCVLLLRRCDWSLHWRLSRASSLLCACHSPVGGRVCSPNVGAKAHRSVSEPWCEVGSTGTLLLGDESLSIPPQVVSTEKCTVWCHPPLTVQVHKEYYCS